ncbi:phenylalanine--tRNA ligase subunit beta [Candidatus Poribacteria bacterium]
MLISLEWLKEYVDFDLSPAELAEELTMVGLELEESISVSTQGLHEVVVGKIVNIEKHPNADKLSLCTVDVGNGKQLPVVCGAPNAKAGSLYPFAPEGAELPNGMKIKAVEIRGETSHGMLCSETELGLGDDASGIMELSPEHELGIPIIEALGLDNVVLDLELTPNRSDCLSILGVAREVSAITGNPLRKPQISLDEGDTKASDLTSVIIEAPDLCPRYAARLVRGVRVGPSPYWMRKRLEDMGLRAINNVVDVTNYVLMELGHPLHAFDLNNLAEKRIVVRRPRPGEQITTLDEVPRELDSDMLLIADGEKPVAVAGVMGGAGSDVTDDTTDILLESAYFDPVSVSKTSKELGLHTEASHRFERGTDIEGLITALNRTAQLIHELAGGEICAGIVDAYPAPRPEAKVKLRPERVNSILGTHLMAADMDDLLTSIEFQVKRNGDDDIDVIIPTFRPDVEREIDLIEEIARLYGYDNIPITVPTGEMQPESADDRVANFREKAGNALVACGLTEVVNYSFHSPDAFDKILLEEDSEYRHALRIRNPISENQSIMRTTLIPGLLANIQHNLNRRISDIQVFEIGRVFHPRNENEQPNEFTLVSGAITGLSGAQLWNQPTRPVDFFDIKGIVESFLHEIGISGYQFRPASQPSIQSGRGAEVVLGDTVLGVLGELSRKVLDNYDMDQDVYIFELDSGKLLECVTPGMEFQPLSVFPSVHRDLAVVVAYDIPSSQIEESIGAVGGDLVKSVNLFDVYKGEQIAASMRSLAYSIEYHSPSRTLTDDEVDKVHENIVSALADEFNAELRK